MTEHLEAGPALDALIAERVFSKRVEDHTFGPRQWHEEPEGDLSGWEEIPPYSTDIAAAFKIVEHFALQHIPVSLYSMSHGVWWCFLGMAPIFDPSDPLKPTHEARANTAPEVICLAALRALAPDRAR